MKNYLGIIDNIFRDYPSDQNKEFGDFIFQLIKEFYDSGLISTSKPKNNELTVFSAVILQNKNDFKIVTYANGTKSLPNKNYKSGDNFKIRDSHAEILALRALKLFIINCLMYNIKKFSKNDYLYKLNQNIIDNFDTSPDFFDIFDLNDKTDRKISLKENIRFHLYISEVPCGDSSIFPKNCKEANNFEDVNNQTGSKTIEEVMNFLNSSKDKNKADHKIVHDNSLGKFRTKSMRNDIDRQKISFSLSCSDKLLIKNLLGIQGKLLNYILKPIYLSTIIISSNYNDRETLYNINESIKRGINILYRSKHRNEDFVSFIDSEKFFSRNFYINDPVIILINNFLDNKEKFGDLKLDQGGRKILCRFLDIGTSPNRIFLKLILSAAINKGLTRIQNT